MAAAQFHLRWEQNPAYRPSWRSFASVIPVHAGIQPCAPAERTQGMEAEKRRECLSVCLLGCRKTRNYYGH